jgi:hypothetical protein
MTGCIWNTRKALEKTAIAYVAKTSYLPAFELPVTAMRTSKKSYVISPEFCKY